MFFFLLWNIEGILKNIWKIGCLGPFWLSLYGQKQFKYLLLCSTEQWQPYMPPIMIMRPCLESMYQTIGMVITDFTLIIKAYSWKGKLRSEANFHVTHLWLTHVAHLVLCKTRLGCGKLGQATMAKNISQSIKLSKSFLPQGTRLWKFSQHIVRGGDACWI